MPIEIIFTIIIAVYTAIGFVAHYKWDKFPYVAMITILICVLGILTCFVWNDSASTLEMQSGN